MSANNEASTSVTFLYHRHVVVYTVNDSNRTTIDRWIDNVHSVVQAWPADQPYYSIHDFSAAKTLFTPYVRSKAMDLVKYHPPIRGRSAIVIPRDNFALQMVRLILRGLKDMGVSTQLFKTVEEAQAWIEDVLPAEVKLPNPE